MLCIISYKIGLIYWLTYMHLTYNDSHLIHSFQEMYLNRPSWCLTTFHTLDSWPVTVLCHSTSLQNDLSSCTSFLKALKGLMAVYYSFNIQYPQSLSLPFLFIQHFLFNIKEDSLPPGIVRFISFVDKL